VDYRDLRWVFVRSSEPRSRNILLREAGCLLEQRPNVPTGTFRFAGFLRRKLLIPGAGFQAGQWTQRVSRGRDVYFRGG
jgi:hypothetical protein